MPSALGTSDGRGKRARRAGRPSFREQLQLPLLPPFAKSPRRRRIPAVATTTTIAMKDGVCTLSATVLEAHALGGTKMFEVKVFCKGKSTSVYKSKEDFKSVLDMFRLVGAMCRAKSDRCEICAACSTLSPGRVCDENSLDEFLGSVLTKLREAEPVAIEQCSTHRGVVQIFMDFLNVRNGKYFCELTPEMEEEISPKSNNSQDLQDDDVDLDHPVSRCSLNRTLSEQFAAMDSVC
ncbi:uncharacterized protein PITG_02178 [Phytophthora infestans T30-4]|uniref:Uncharacterized protein n=1 Tax=Phytophthora infestans (strain T30-4) TaxID=403677 RepID=D0MVP0_PHYIT|nr:uncharacterized protein PITG_02178 [Phytophthora infestans T30-4]EEY63703.1 conserved hypothetical protein [Phytophthora infestans T30-4]|eukprot:XP_002907139.1 conserved hypothetical protein [Phytophthora infestans T30-4]